MLAISIGALMVGIATMSMRSRFEDQARRTANKLNGAMHYLYARAATEGKTFRLAFDFEKQAYWVEMAGEIFLITSSDGGASSGSRGSSKGAKPAATKAAPVGDQVPSDQGATDETAEEGPSTPFKSPTAAEFGVPPNLPRSLADTVALPQKVVLKEVIVTTQRKEPISDGLAYIHFFPQGYTEPAILNFANPDGDRFMALEVNPLTGFSKVFWEHREHK